MVIKRMHLSSSNYSLSWHFSIFGKILLYCADNIQQVHNQYHLEIENNLTHTGTHRDFQMQSLYHYEKVFNRLKENYIILFEHSRVYDLTFTFGTRLISLSSDNR